MINEHKVAPLPAYQMVEHQQLTALKEMQTPHRQLEGNYGVLTKESFNFLMGMSKNISLATDEMKSINQTKNAGNGHGIGGVNGSTAAFVMFAVILLIMITLYLGFKVYRKKQFFTVEWEKTHGPSKHSKDKKKDLGDINEMADRSKKRHKGREAQYSDSNIQDHSQVQLQMQEEGIVR